ncbi:MAG: hypothetical protein IPI22_05200 [Bacteroidetes bacterium]|nr:hypothetical protein [Bacteroidota bacterium]
MKYKLSALQILIRGKVVLLSLLLVIANNSEAQNVAWSNGITNTNDFISLKNICTNQLGETYAVGQFKNTVDFDAGPGFDIINANIITPQGNAGFITKTDNAGNHLWAKALIPYATNAGSIMYDVAVDMNGNVYVAGVYNKAIDFDPGAAIDSLNVSGTAGSFVMKLDAAGNFLWAKTFLDINTVMRSIKTDQNNNVIISGFFNVTVDFDPSPAVFNLTPTNVMEVCLLKLDSNGDFIWAKSWVNSRPNLGTLAKNNLDIDNGNNIYLSGKIINDSIDLDPGAGVYADSGNSFVLKLDASANFIWGHGTSAITSLVCVSKYGDLYVAGTPSGLATKSYLSKYDIAGTALWVKILPDSLVQGQYFTGNVHALNEDTSGNIVMGGKNNSSRYFLYTTDSSGLLSWYKNANGGTNTELSVKVNADNELLVAGNMSDVLDVDFGPAIDTVGLPNKNGFFLMKYNYCGNNFNMYYDGCDSLVLPDSTYLSNANYIKEYLDVNNCDSNVFIHVTLHTLPDVLINACDTAFYNGQAYTQTGVYSQVIPNPYGCDSVVNITVNINTPAGLPPILNLIQTFQPVFPPVPTSNLPLSYNIEVDSLFNMYISGTFSYEIDFNPLGAPYLDTSYSAYYQPDGFVTRYDSSGILNWMHQLYTINPWGNEYTPSLCLNDGLELYSVTYGSGGANIGMNKVNQFAYANTWFGETPMNGYTGWNVNQILNDPSSNLPVKIGFMDSIDFNYAYKKLLVWRGNNVATFAMGGQFIGMNGVVDSQGNIYVVNTVQPVFGGTTYCAIAKLDSNLNMLWNKQIAKGNDIPPIGMKINQLKIDTNGSLLLCGRFSDTLDIDISPNTYNLISNGGFDAFVARFDTSANFIWAQSFGGADDDYANSITTDLNDRIYLGGSFSSQTIDLDPTAGISFLMKGCVNADWQGGYISKFKPDGTFMNAMGSGKNITELEFKAPKRIYATGIPFVQVFELGNDIIVNVSDTICAGDSVVVGNSVYYQTGVYTAIFPLGPAIDSIVITNLIVNALPLVVANATDSVLCLGDSVTLFGSGANTYVWNNLVIDNVIFSPIATSNYVVTGTDINGCVNTDSITVVVNALPSVTANASDTLICYGDSIFWGGIGFWGGAHSFSGGGGGGGGGGFPQRKKNFPAGGRGGGGGGKTRGFPWGGGVFPGVPAIAADTLICYGDSILLFGAGALSYTWNNLAIDSVLFAPFASGYYVVNGTDTNGCSQLDSIEVMVQVLPTVIANASDTSLCMGDSVTMHPILLFVLVIL